MLPDRNPLFVVLSDGSLRNNYTVKILNKLHDVRQLPPDGRRPSRRQARDCGLRSTNTPRSTSFPTTSAP